MSASKLALYGIGTTLFRNPRTLSSSSFIVFSKPINFPFKPPPRFLHRRASISSSAAAAADVSAFEQDTSQKQYHHPWPEWVSFLDRLNTKGYFTKPSPSSSSSSGGEDVVVAADVDDAVYVNMNLLKDACLSFGRDRYDLLKLLSLTDIQAVVEGGCPNLLRKAVNSAKRLRAHLQLDEGNVCSACSLRDSCDRAYVTLKEFEADARTVDVVRILLFYALDPLVLSGGESPSGREVIESSVRKLLSQLIELSESSPAPAPVLARTKPTAQNAVAKRQPVTTGNLSANVEMKKGDWFCPKCNFMNFSRKMQCLNCNEDKPRDIEKPSVEMKEGDWTCPECKFMNFSRNLHCLKCKTEGPKMVVKEVEMKKGDWNCPQCGFMNFANNAKCFRCTELRPKKYAGDWSCPSCGFMNFSSKTRCFRCEVPNPSQKKYPGDWNCPKCDFYNYARNKNCLKCNTEKANQEPNSEYDEHEWRRSN